MRLVFITRKVDRGDALTGFVFSWLEKLAGHLEKLYVICQEKGDTSGLPSNVAVHSFGKEKGYGKFRQGYKLFVISFKFGRKANGFFVHMHPIYAIVAWLPAKLFGKKLILWYTHKSVDLKLRVAHALVDEVLTASAESFRLPSNKVKIVGHGIDATKFTPTLSPPIPFREGTGGDERGGKFRILSIGRISPVKDYETLIKAVQILVNHKGVKDIDLQIHGRIGLPEHQSYLDSLVTFVENAGLDDYIDFQSEVNHEFVDEIYREADLFVNLSATGSIDKTVLEAAASGILTLTSNEAFAIPLSKISPLLFFERDHPEDLADKILQLKNLPEREKQAIQGQLRSWVEADHNLANLTERIIAQFK